MRRYIRDKQGSCYAFTLCLADRQSSLLTDNMPAFRRAYRLAKANHPIDLHAMVVLPEHVHILLSVHKDTNYSYFIGVLKSQFSRQLPMSTNETINQSRQRNGERGIWQRRFWEHKIRSEADFNNHMNYIHYNPVKHGLVTTVADWQFSTFHYWQQQGVYPMDWACSLDDLANFGE